MKVNIHAPLEEFTVVFSQNMDELDTGTGNLQLDGSVTTRPASSTNHLAPNYVVMSESVVSMDQLVPPPRHV